MIGASQRRRELTDALSFLADEFGQWMVPLLERVALLVDDASSEAQAGDEPNGFDGISTRGSLDRLLLSEWLLASEEPDEFVRRYVTSELSYLQIDRQRPASTARIEVVVDSGPVCVGAPRLAFLLVMTVLAHQASALGVPFALGILGDEPGTFQEGTLSDLFADWLRSRRPFVTDDAHITEWLDSGEPDAKRWLLVGGLPSQRHRNTQVVRAEATNWNDQGVSGISVWVNNRTATLPIAEPASAIRLLRGFGLRKRDIAPRDHLGAQEFRFPRFWTSANRLLLRTHRSDVLLSLRVDETGKTQNTLRRHQFDGPVIAASVVGDRVVAAVITHDELRIQVIGKSLGHADSVAVPVSSLPFDPWLELDTDLPPLLFESGFMLRAGAKWHFIQSDLIQTLSVHAMAGSVTTDQPRKAYFISGTLYVNPTSMPTHLTLSPSDVLLGAAPTSFAVRADDGWLIADAKHQESIAVDPDDSVVGLVDLDDGLALLTLSAGRHILRLRSARRVKTLTENSGQVADYSLHPTRPLLAVHRAEGDLEVLNLRTGSTVCRLQPGDQP
jgi:hypothetical protein